MRAIWACSILAGGCIDPIAVPPAPFDPTDETVLLALINGGTVTAKLGTPTLSMQYGRRTNEDLQGYTFAWSCDSASQIGFGLGSSPLPASTRPPDRTYELDADTYAWAPIERADEDVFKALGLSLLPNVGCDRYERVPFDAPLVTDDNPGFAVTISQDEVLVGSPQLGVWSFREMGSPVKIEITGVDPIPASGATIGPDGLLYLYGDGGSLARGPKTGGAFEVLATNPAASSCVPAENDGRRTDVIISDSDTLWVAEDDGSLDSFSLSNNQWTEVWSEADARMGLADDPEHGCTLEDVDVLALGPKEVLALQTNRLIHVRETVVTDETIRGQVPRSLMESTQLGVLVGSALGAVYQRSANGTYSPWIDRGNRFETVSDLIERGDQLIFSMGGGMRIAFAASHGSAELCSDYVDEGGIYPRFIRPLGNSILFVPYWSDSSSRNFLRYSVAEPGPCESFMQRLAN